MTDTTISNELIAKYQGLTTAAVSSVMSELGYANVCMPGIRAFTPGLKMVGRAVTVRFVPIREDQKKRLADLRAQGVPLPSHVPFHRGKAGQVIVADAQGDLSAGIIGDMLIGQFHRDGGTGVVVDGAVRDYPILKDMGCPLFLKGTNPYASNRNKYAADVNVPIQCGGILVLPGDLIFGDDDGVLAYPFELAEQVAEKAAENEAVEAYAHDRILAGAPIAEYYPPGPKVREEYFRERGRG
ncbi:MAG: hypothetical protein U0821_17535 [Chloroflexota bacterium]